MSIESACLGAFVEPGSFGFMPNTFRLQLLSSPASSADSPGQTPPKHCGTFGRRSTVLFVTFCARDSEKPQLGEFRPAEVRTVDCEYFGLQIYDFAVDKSSRLSGVIAQSSRRRPSDTARSKALEEIV